MINKYARDGRTGRYAFYHNFLADTEATTTGIANHEPINRHVTSHPRIDQAFNLGDQLFAHRTSGTAFQERFCETIKAQLETTVLSYPVV